MTLGSAGSRTLDAGIATVTDVAFAANAVIDRHRHARPVLAVMLSGAFQTHIGRRRFECAAGRLWTEPAEEAHTNYASAAGARVLAVQPDPAHADVWSPFADLLDGPRLLRDGALATVARRLAAELGAPDDLTPLALGSLVTELAVRSARGARAAGGPPQWLARARDLLHARFREGPSLEEVAAAVGVHPSHFAHEFRRHFGTGPATYARRLRVLHAAELLERSADPLAAVAAAAGFSDQSHLTRECRRHLGVTPGGIRRAAAGAGCAADLARRRAARLLPGRP